MNRHNVELSSIELMADTKWLKNIQTKNQAVFVAYKISKRGFYSKTNIKRQSYTLSLVLTIFVNTLTFSLLLIKFFEQT